MNESEQAQAIAEQDKQTVEKIRGVLATDLKWVEDRGGFAGDVSPYPYLRHVPDLLKIVDSQAQKIAELEKEIIVAKNVATAFATKCAEKEQKLAQLTKERDEQTAAAYRLGVDGREKIAEQEKEIERLNRSKGEQNEI